MTAEHDDTFDYPEGYEPTTSSGVKQLDLKALTVAMMSAEGDVDMPGLRQPGSIVSNLIGLNVGENYTKSLLVDDAVTMEVFQANLTEWKHRLRHTVNQAVRRARDFDKRKLAMETSQTLTPTGRIYVQVIVTRTE